MALLIAAYFGAVSTALALLAFPQLRRELVARVTATGQLGARHSTQLVHRCADAMSTLHGSSTQAIRRGFRQAHDKRAWLLLAATLVALPPLLVLLGNAGTELQYSETTSGADRRIAALLTGEQLVPPLPLPPAVFQTREVERVIPEVANASRDWIRLDSAFRQRLLMVFRTMRDKHGYELTLLEGYRSPERQARLASLGPQVTRAGAMMSYHQYGLAADVAFVMNGRIVIDENDPRAARGYQLYGELAEAFGLTWGGRWTMRDFGHVELRRPGVLGRPSENRLVTNP